MGSFPVVKSITAKKVLLNDIYDDKITNSDSLLLFKSHKYHDYWIYAFDKRNGNLVGKLCPKGEGPKNYHYCIDSEQLIQNSLGEELLWVRDPYSSCRLINISRSIQTGKTICDSIIPMNWVQVFQYPATAMFFLKDSLILAKNQCEAAFVNDIDYSPGRYHLYKASLNSVVREYVLYKKPIIPSNKKASIPFMNYYSSCDRLKPDGTKVVMAMQSVGQINILNLETGSLTGIRQAESIDFNELTDITEPIFYYTTTAVDNQFIFAAYSGACYQNGYPGLASVIHVFNWDGAPVYKIKIDKPVFCISFDVTNKTIYGSDFQNNVYEYDVSFIYKKNTIN